MISTRVETIERLMIDLHMWNVIIATRWDIMRHTVPNLVCVNQRPQYRYSYNMKNDESSCKEGGDSHSTSDDDFKKEYGFNIIGTRQIDQSITSTLEILLAQRNNSGHISKSWILIHRQSIVSIFNNMYLLLKGSINECESGQGLRCFCNGGYQDSNLTWEAPYFGEV